MKFTFEKFDPYKNKRSPIYYLSNKIPVLQHEEFLQAKVTSRNNGPNTAYAQIYKTVEWSTNEKQHFYYVISKHFDGKNACQKAIAWCNYLLKNTPNYCQNGKGPINIKEHTKQLFKTCQEREVQSMDQ